MGCFDVFVLLLHDTLLLFLHPYKKSYRCLVSVGYCVKFSAGAFLYPLPRRVLLLWTERSCGCHPGLHLGRGDDQGEDAGGELPEKRAGGTDELVRLRQLRDHERVHGHGVLPRPHGQRSGDAVSRMCIKGFGADAHRLVEAIPKPLDDGRVRRM